MKTKLQQKTQGVLDDLRKASDKWARRVWWRNMRRLAIIVGVVVYLAYPIFLDAFEQLQHHLH